MQIKITTKELEYAAQKYIKQDFKFDIVDEKTISLSYKIVSVNLYIEKIDGSDIYLDTKLKILRLNKVIRFIYDKIAESKIPELLSVNDQYLVVHLGKIDSLKKVLDKIALTSISFSKQETLYARTAGNANSCLPDIENHIGIVTVNVKLK